MASKPTPKQKSRVTIKIDKSAKSPGATTLEYRGLFLGEFAPGKEISNLDSKDSLIQIKKKKDLEKAIEQMEPNINIQFEDGSMEDVELTFRSMQDFHPDQIIAQIQDNNETIKRILEMRKKLKMLKVKMLQDKKLRNLLEDVLKEGNLKELEDKLGPLENPIKMD